MTRVLIVHDLLGDLGGAEASVRQSAQALTRDGMDVALLYGTDTGSALEHWHTTFPTRWSWLTNRVTAMAAALAWQPQVVWVHNLRDLEVLEALVATRLRLIRTVHDHHLFCQRGSRYFPWNRRPCTRRAGYACALTCAVLRNRTGPLPIRLAWPGKKLHEIELCKAFHRTLVNSTYMRDELLLHRFDANRLIVLYPAPPSAPLEHIATYERPLIVFAGQLVRGKGCDILLRALATLGDRPWQALIAGDGDQLQTCIALATKLGIADRVTFSGRVPRAELPIHWRDARMGVMPSLWPEPLGLAGIEYMLHGLPVIAFDVGGIRDWLDHGETGFVIPHGDIVALSSAIGTLLDNRELASQMGTLAAQRSAQRFNASASHAQLRAILEGEAGTAALTP